MILLIIIFLAIILLATFLAPRLRESLHSNKPEDIPYIKKEYLMTKAEHEFFKVLERAVQGRYYIVPQVQLSNLVQVEKQKRWEYSLRNKIDRKSVDFVLFNKEFFTPHLVIELDDTSHSKEDRIARDGFVDRVLDKTGIKITHVKAAYNYDLSDIQKLL